MGLAADGSYGVLVMQWRRVTIAGELHVHEIWASDKRGVLYGPIESEAAAAQLIKDRATTMRKTWRLGSAELLDRYPQSKIPAHEETDDPGSETKEPGPRER